MGRRIALFLVVVGLLIVPSLCRPDASARRVGAASAASSQGAEPEEDARMGDGKGDGEGEGEGEAVEGRAMDPSATGTQCNITGACLICTEQQKVEDPACQPTGYRQAISCIERYSGAVSSLPSARARAGGAAKTRGDVAGGARQAFGEAGARGSSGGRGGINGAGGDGGELQEGGGGDGAGEGREAQEIDSNGSRGRSGSSKRRIQERGDGVVISEGLGGEDAGRNELRGGKGVADPSESGARRRLDGRSHAVQQLEAVGYREGSGSVEGRAEVEVVQGWGQEEGTMLLRRLLGEVRTVQVAGRVSSMEASAEEEGARGGSSSSSSNGGSGGSGSGSRDGLGGERMRRFLTYESCKPEVETLSVLGFEGIMLAILAVCGPVVYHRKRKGGMAAGTVRLSNSSNRF
ncbi:hypothetical protein CLOP_g12783 [Closterium sp. NIES-67]|nr:hypothetical protein CLOP_g12783 [Closterium sp. NIES-67]